jgi:hypothetical protein
MVTASLAPFLFTTIGTSRALDSQSDARLAGESVATETPPIEITSVPWPRRGAAPSPSRRNDGRQSHVGRMASGPHLAVSGGQLGCTA